MTLSRETCRENLILRDDDRLAEPMQPPWPALARAHPVDLSARSGHRSLPYRRKKLASTGWRRSAASTESSVRRQNTSAGWNTGPRLALWGIENAATRPGSREDHFGRDRPASRLVDVHPGPGSAAAGAVCCAVIILFVTCARVTGRYLLPI